MAQTNMNSDRELLEELFRFMVQRNYIQGEEQSIRDMVLRYKQPPLTLLHRVCMQMTKPDYDQLENLLGRIVEHFNPDKIPVENWSPDTVYFFPDPNEKVSSHDPI